MFTTLGRHLGVPHQIGESSLKGNETPPSDLNLNAFLIRAEAFINSRPLVEIPLEHADDNYLTPNHFLLGVGGGTADALPYSDNNVANHKIYKRILLDAAKFWQLWINHYLPTLNKRGKWQKVTRPLVVGDIVVIVDEQAPKRGWRRGRVVALKATAGEYPRAATVLVDGRTLERPVTKLVVLDVRKEPEEGPETPRGPDPTPDEERMYDECIGGSPDFEEWDSEPAITSTRVSKKDIHPRAGPSKPNRPPAMPNLPSASTASMGSLALSSSESMGPITGGSSDTESLARPLGGTQSNTTASTAEMNSGLAQRMTTRSQVLRERNDNTYTVSTRSTDRNRPIPVHVCSHEEALNFMADLQIYSREPTPEPRDEFLGPYPVPDLPGHSEAEERRRQGLPPSRIDWEPTPSWKFWNRREDWSRREDADKENQNEIKYQDEMEHKHWRGPEGR